MGVCPEVKVSSQQSDGVTKLHCQVYGFYPRDVDVNWKRGGTEIPSDEAKQVLPNTDGTYQITVTVEVLPEEVEIYSCHVDHSSLNETLIVNPDVWPLRYGQTGDREPSKRIPLAAFSALQSNSTLGSNCIYKGPRCRSQRPQMWAGIWDSAQRHATARHGTARHGTARHGTARHGTA
ncbi:major histocompatibility complex class I-related gene -like, partial [Pelobates cultripes]